MKNKSKETLTNREKEIMQLLDDGDQTAVFAFNLLRIYFSIDDIINNRNHSKLIDYIYVKRLDVTKWEQANLCNIGDRSAFRYRNVYTWLQNELKTAKDVINLTLNFMPEQK